MDTDNCKIFQDTENMSTNQNVDDINEDCSSLDIEHKNNCKNNSKNNCKNRSKNHYEFTGKSNCNFTDTVHKNVKNYCDSSKIDLKENVNTQNVNDQFILYDKSLNLEENKVIEILSRHVNIKSELLKALPDFNILTNCAKKCYEQNKFNEQTTLDDSFLSNNNSNSSIDHLQSLTPFTIDFPLTEDILMTEIKEEISLSLNRKRKKYVINKPKRKYFCEKCGSKFTSSYGMKYHIDKVHTKEKDQVVKPFHCPFEKCTKKYKNNNGLKYHLKNQHDKS